MPVPVASGSAGKTVGFEYSALRVINQSDVNRWHELGWLGRLRKRLKYSGMPYSEVFRTLEWEEYTFWVFSNCDYYILSGGGSLLPDIMKTPVAQRDRQVELRKHMDESIDRFLVQMRSRKN